SSKKEMVAKEVGACVSFRQSKPRATRTLKYFSLFTLSLSKGSIGQKKAMSFRQKEESQKKQEMFRLVYPELVQGLNRTKEGYVIHTKGANPEIPGDISACLP